ncbi:MAG: hypothetical protein M1415_02420 [Firmicutes bacterium]|nr:hypothetical protein [Bacillota bacterium]
METLSSAQLQRLAQIELRCMQECIALFPETVPNSVCDLICQHAQAAHQFSEQLWTKYHLTVHGHVPTTLHETQEVTTR